MDLPAPPVEPHYLQPHNVSSPPTRSPTTHPVAHGTRTPMRLQRDGAAGLAALGTSPISAHTGSIAADSTQSLSSYRGARSCLRERAPDNLAPLPFSSQLAPSFRDSLRFLHSFLLFQYHRIGECLIVVRMERHQLSHVLCRSCQQQRTIHFHARSIDALVVHSRLQPTRAHKFQLNRVFADLHSCEGMRSRKM